MNRRRVVTGTLGLGAVTAAGAWAWTNRWKYVVVHHSAGGFGTIEFLQRVHRERQPNDPVDAIPYHYVIGNGNGLGLGEIARDWRGEWGVWGAHVSGNNSPINARGIGICLIGNFEEREVPPEQFDSLVTLTRHLMSRHDIEPAHVLAHGRIAGEATKCPGKRFPWERFKRVLST